jgi:hypothetical protein
MIWCHAAVNASRENIGRRRIYHFNEVAAHGSSVFKSSNPEEIVPLKDS